MIIFDDNLNPYIFDNIYTPTHIEYFYTLNLDIIDFTLTPLLALEEVTCPAFLVEFDSFKFYLPTSYYILIYAEETSQLDTIKIADLTNSPFQIFTYNGKTDKIVNSNIKILEYKPEHTFVIPFLNKNQFLCHPVMPDTWICITPYDQYKKMNNLVIGDLMI
jgi:hypothetical protein